MFNPAFIFKDPDYYYWGNMYYDDYYDLDDWNYYYWNFYYYYLDWDYDGDYDYYFT